MALIPQQKLYSYETMASSSAVLCLSFREAHTSRRHSVSQGWIPGPRRKPCRPSKIESICSQVEFHFSVLWGFDRCFEKLSSLALTEISLVHTSATDCSLCLRNHIFFFLYSAVQRSTGLPEPYVLGPVSETQVND